MSKSTARLGCRRYLHRQDDFVEEEVPRMPIASVRYHAGDGLLQEQVNEGRGRGSFKIKRVSCPHIK